MIESPELMTADELLTYDVPGRRTELIRGRLVVHEPPGGEHASVVFELSFLIGVHLRSTNPRAGKAFAGDPGFWISRNPDTVRAPDIAFVKRERLEGGAAPRGFIELAPDLAIEVRSPSDRTGEVLQKIGQWIGAGCTLVWVVDPQRCSAQVYTAEGTVTLLGEHDALDGAPVLPGLSIPLAALWRESIDAIDADA